MNTTIPWQMLLLLALLSQAAADATAGGFFAECPITRCGEAGPEIRYPFRKVEQNFSCGVPGFELTCKYGSTILNLPHEGPFYVQSIDYRAQALKIGDPHGCLVNRTIMPWNLSSALFHREEDQIRKIKNFSLFNCGSINASTIEDMGYSNSSFIHINCSTFESQIYAARSDESLMVVPPSCERLETSAILDDEVGGAKDPLDITTLLRLKWEDRSGCRSCEDKGQMCGLDLTTHTTACLNPPSLNYKYTGGLTSAATIGIIATIIFSAVLATVFYYWDHKFGGHWELDQYEVEKFLDSYQSFNPKRYSYSDVKRMTNHFRQKLGEGGFGSVYRGRLPNGIPVAVKAIETSKSNGDEFLNEVATIGRVHHVNVVRLLGFCAERFKRALVYEFMPNGSLEKFIFSSESKPCELGWDKLQEIAVGIARGMEYLHQGCDQRILHFDIKPHNILLDHKFTPKISDFGLAKFCSKDQSNVSMTAARGTVGYIAPEVVSRNFGNISYKSDVYSFGMLLLEMVGKRKNIDVNVEHTSQVYFPEWIYNRVNLQQELGAGEVLTGEEDEVPQKLEIVALWCIQLNPVDRPNMEKVVQMLEGARTMLEMPPNPFVSSIT